MLLIQTVASKLHGTEVEVKILKTKEECDHVQFVITELSGPGKTSRPEAAQIETLSIGKCTEYLLKRTFV
jgi:guanylate cyclase soluble subunit beta